MNDLLLRGTRIWGDGIADIAIRDGRIAAIGAAASTVGAKEIVDATGTIALPGLVDGHAHLDKTLWGTPWHSHRAGPTVLERIDNERRVLRALGLSPARQSARLLRHMVARGTTHVRTHVDVGPETRLTHVHGVMETRDAHRDCIDMQIVAFPQTGVLCQPGTIELLDHAVRDGAELVGGLDPAAIDGNAAGQLDALFAIAARRGCRNRHPSSRTWRAGCADDRDDLRAHAGARPPRPHRHQPCILPRHAGAGAARGAARPAAAAGHRRNDARAQRLHAVSTRSDAGTAGRAVVHWLGWRARCVGTAQYRGHAGVHTSSPTTAVFVTIPAWSLLCAWPRSAARRNLGSRTMG